jgi:signal transduction histidine kinase
VTFAPSRAFVTDRAFLVTVLPASMIALVMSLTIMLVALMSTGQRARLTMLVRARTRDLAESEHRYRSVVDNVHEAIFQLDDRDRISFVSAGWHDDLSIGGRSGALGASLTEVIRLADTATLRELLDQARQAPGSTVHHEFESIDRSSIYEIRLTAHPTDGASDAEPGDPAMAASIFGIIVDMTTQREGLRNRERFVSLVAHELRNPLTVISGSVATIADHEQDLLPPLTAKLLPAVQSSAHRLDRIISDLLVSSQIDAGTLSLVAASTDLVALVRASITAAEPTAVEHGVQLTDDLPDDGLQVMCDPDRVAQVVDNLLSNAIKYTPGGGTIHAAMQVDERADVVRVIVRDSGIGIARDDRARVFERFGRTEQGTIAAPGTGLGLSICLAIAEAHDGSIELLSELGVGSTFSLVLPLH